MRRFLLWTMLVFGFVSCRQFASIPENSLPDKKTRMDLAIQQEFERTVDPELGYVPRERLDIAKELIRSGGMKAYKAAIPNIQWIEHGPNNVGGRTRTLMFDPNDDTYSRVFAAGISGGLWVTENIYSSSPKWNVIDDFFDNLAITCMAYDPARPDTMYFGTGEGYYNLDAVRGDGIWRSTNGGSVWTKITQSGVDTFNYIQKIKVDNQGNVYASTRDQGVIKSTNAGATWSKILGTGMSATTNRANDLDIDANGNIWVTMGIFNSDGIYKSNNGGSSWTKVSTGSGFPGSGFSRLEVACAPTDSNRVYVLVHSSSTDSCSGIYKSTNGGSSWTSVSMAYSTVDFKNFANNQAWYNLTIEVSPVDADIVLIGGLDLYKTSNAGASWQQISHWYGGGGYPEVHADHHAILFRKNSGDTALFGNDGGVYLATGLSGTPTFSSKESGYYTSQFYSCALHPDRFANYMLGGTQDNGSQQFTTSGINSTIEVTGGDGGYCHIDQDQADTQITAYVFNNIRVSTNGFSSYTSYSDNSGNFINTSDFDDINNILYSARGNNELLRWSNIGGSISKTTITLTAMGTSQASAITVSPNISGNVYIGTEGGRVVKVTGANGGGPSGTNISGGSFPSGTVSCIAVETGNEDHLLATFSNYGVNSVWESTNGGSSWTSVEGNLPDMPVRWAIFSPLGADSVLLATELGVWSTTNLNGGSTDWQSSNTGLANVRVDMLQYRNSDSLIIAATHGRGMYSTKAFSATILPQISISDSIVYPGEYILFNDNSYGVTSRAWDMDGDGITDTTAESFSWAFGTGGYHTVILTINGNQKDTQIVHVLPRLGTPYSTGNGGDFESNFWHFGGKSISGGINLWEHGAPGNTLTTVNSGTRVWKTDLDADIVQGTYSCGLYSPSFNLQKAGTYTLSFLKSMEVTYCNAPFGVQVQYSTDQGYTWHRLGDYGSGTGWYNRGAATCGSCCIVSSIFSDNTGWTGNYSNSTSSYDISNLAGNHDVRFRVVLSVVNGYSSVGYQNDGFMVEDFSISGPSNNALQDEVETDICARTQYLGPNDTAWYYSPNGKAMMRLRNLSSHDFGNTTVYIDQSGSVPVNFDTLTEQARRILAKSFYISPTNNNSGAPVEISAVYDKSEEIDNWRSHTSHNYNDLQLFKSTVSISSATLANTVYGDSTIIDSLYGGDGVRITARFSNGFSGVGAGGGGNNSPGPLPVSWLYFHGLRQTGNVFLEWATAQEINNSLFTIERSLGSTFEDIGTIPGKGNSQSISVYQYNDLISSLDAEPTLFYRIRQTDFEGKSSWSNVVALPLDKQANDIINLYPIPAENFIHLTIPAHKEPMTFRLFDAQGRKVFELPLKRGINTADLGKLAPALYHYEIGDDRTILSKGKLPKN